MEALERFTPHRAEDSDPQSPVDDAGPPAPSHDELAAARGALWCRLARAAEDDGRLARKDAATLEAIATFLPRPIPSLDTLGRKMGGVTGDWARVRRNRLRDQGWLRVESNWYYPRKKGTRTGARKPGMGQTSCRLWLCVPAWALKYLDEDPDQDGRATPATETVHSRPPLNSLHPPGGTHFTPPPELTSPQEEALLRGALEGEEDASSAEAAAPALLSQGRQKSPDEPTDDKDQVTDDQVPEKSPDFDATKKVKDQDVSDLPGVLDALKDKLKPAELAAGLAAHEALRTVPVSRDQHDAVVLRVVAGARAGLPAKDSGALARTLAHTMSPRELPLWLAVGYRDRNGWRGLDVVRQCCGRVVAPKLNAEKDTLFSSCKCGSKYDPARAQAERAAELEEQARIRKLEEAKPLNPDAFGANVLAGLERALEPPDQVSRAELRYRTQAAGLALLAGRGAEARDALRGRAEPARRPEPDPDPDQDAGVVAVSPTPARVRETVNMRVFPGGPKVSGMAPELQAGTTLPITGWAYRPPTQAEPVAAVPGQWVVRRQPASGWWARTTHPKNWTPVYVDAAVLDVGVPDQVRAQLEAQHAAAAV